MSKRNTSRADDLPPRTIEDIERRAAEVRDAEREALRSLAAHVRELAVQLPPESRVPIRFANLARELDLFEDHAEAAFAVLRQEVVNEVVREQVEDWVASLQQWLGRR